MTTERTFFGSGIPYNSNNHEHNLLLAEAVGRDSQSMYDYSVRQETLRKRETVRQKLAAIEAKMQVWSAESGWAARGDGPKAFTEVGKITKLGKETDDSDEYSRSDESTRDSERTVSEYSPLFGRPGPRELEKIAHFGDWACDDFDHCEEHRAVVDSDSEQHIPRQKTNRGAPQTTLEARRQEAESRVSSSFMKKGLLSASSSEVEAFLRQEPAAVGSTGALLYPGEDDDAAASYAPTAEEQKLCPEETIWQQQHGEDGGADGAISHWDDGGFEHSQEPCCAPYLQGRSAEFTAEDCSSSPVQTTPLPLDDDLQIPAVIPQIPDAILRQISETGGQMPISFRDYLQKGAEDEEESPSESQEDRRGLRCSEEEASDDTDTDAVQLCLKRLSTPPESRRRRAAGDLKAGGLKLSLASTAAPASGASSSVGDVTSSPSGGASSVGRSAISKPDSKVAGSLHAAVGR